MAKVKKSNWVLFTNGRNVQLHVNRGGGNDQFKKVYSDRVEFFKSKADLRNGKISRTTKIK